MSNVYAAGGGAPGTPRSGPGVGSRRSVVDDRTMHIDPYIVLGSAIVGFLVGMTGAGGGALMTPMLILLFGVKPSAAISSDLVAAVVMRPVGAGSAPAQRHRQPALVGWMVLGSVPMAFLGAYLLHLMGARKGGAAEHRDGAWRGAAAGRGGDGAALRARQPLRTEPHRRGARHRGRTRCARWRSA